MPTLRPERVAVRCVAENREPYISEALCLFRSLNAFGGRLSRAQKTAFFVDAVNADAKAMLEDEGVTVKVSKRMDMRCPCSNKLGMLHEGGDYDLLMAIDCDVVVARDFLDELDQDVFMGRVVGKNPLTIEQWNSLVSRFGLTLPDDRYLSMGFAGETPPFYNGGVLAIPQKYVHDFSLAWDRFISEMFNVYAEHPDIDAVPKYFTDEFAIMLAIFSEKLPYRMFPIEMNFPVNSPIHPSFHPEKMEPYLLHHHHRFSKKGLFLTEYANINKSIRAINKELCKLDIRYVPKAPPTRETVKNYMKRIKRMF